MTKEPQHKAPSRADKHGAWRPILAAFQFLSRFPVRAELDFTSDLLRRSITYYPLVGAAIGVVVWAGGLFADWLLPSFPAAILCLLIWVGLTGGLHLDGWMDTADGLLSYRSRDKMLDIMKDSRVGAMGVLACVLLLILKASLLTSLFQGCGMLASGLAIWLAPLWSRWFMTRAMHRWPKARQGEGLAAQFNGFSERDVWGSTIMAVTLSIVVLLLTLLVLLGGMDESTLLRSLLFIGLSPIVAWAAGTWAARRINAKLGGLTGDTYGALGEGLEAVLLLFAVLIFSN
ncbi:adenosylcobinamide-GDP ribazoletransferase [Paenibacillus barengoltzii]|uniref:adenosylcobinamide-GDP ribazoletransferase n=1 Tax=Paenibacillus barengoltzii TaxID=343517 RepID=UPI002FD9EE32